MNQPLTAAVRYLSGEREPVRVATTANIALQGLQTIDGVALEVGDRVLVKDQTDQKQNGIYLASDGLWFRAPDASQTRAINNGVTVAVQEGAAGGGKTYRFSSANPVVGTDPIVLSYFLSSNLADDIVAAAEAAVSGVVQDSIDAVAPILEAAENERELAEAARLAAEAAAAGVTIGLAKARAVASVNINLSAPGASIDGVAMAAGQSFLATAQTAPAQNGLYVWNGAAVAATRHPFYTTYDAIAGQYFSVLEGAVNADTLWRSTSDFGGTIGSDPIVIARYIQSLTDGSVTLAKTESGLIADYVQGLTLSNNATDANNDIDIATGSAKGNSRVVVNSATMTKRLDAAWASGTGNGGLDTGSKANSTTYHVHAISNDSTGAFDALFSLSATAPTVPSGWTRVQRLGAVITDASGNIRAFSQDGKTFLLTTMVNDISDATLSTTSKLYALTVPNGIKVDALIRLAIFDTGFCSALLTSPDEADQAAGAAGPNSITNAAANGRGSATLQVRTNTSRQVRAVGQGASLPIDDFQGRTFGWIDTSLQRI